MFEAATCKKFEISFLILNPGGQAKSKNELAQCFSHNIVLLTRILT